MVARRECYIVRKASSRKSAREIGARRINCTSSATFGLASVNFERDDVNDDVNYVSCIDTKYTD